MRWTHTEARWRDAVLASLLPAPGDGLPALEEVDLSEFWVAFEASAPSHLRLGFRAACVALGAVAPRLLGHGSSLAALDPEQRERVITRAAELGAFTQLVEIAKVVACLGYFADPAVQATGRLRGHSAGATEEVSS